MAWFDLAHPIVVECPNCFGSEVHLLAAGAYDRYSRSSDYFSRGESECDDCGYVGADVEFEIDLFYPAPSYANAAGDWYSASG